jgi:hypothetical protein
MHFTTGMSVDHEGENASTNIVIKIKTIFQDFIKISILVLFEK